VGMQSLGGGTRVSFAQFRPEELLVLTLRTEESLLVIRGLGIQTSTTSSTYLSTSTTRFIPTNLIQDIFIHEAFKGFEVKFYLAVVVEGEEEVVVVFPVGPPFYFSSYFYQTIQTQPDTDRHCATVQNLLPKRKILEQVWRGARDCLYEPK
jgi:phosphatidylinositol glycan class H protein